MATSRRGPNVGATKVIYTLRLCRIVGRSKKKYLDLELWVEDQLEDHIPICKEDILWLLDQDDQPPSLVGNPPV